MKEAVSNNLYLNLTCLIPNRNKMKTKMHLQVALPPAFKSRISGNLIYRFNRIQIFKKPVNQILTFN